ncbi:hypothetical protein BDN72DRAFT_906418 [Pluteus cervinus]|uniref:Uncharacterized protein n=1 Tax=Pluteus cervinus TaxID=181527 RepID=A0ACD2ZZL0_9AGAR|nr:hypothetical protein BDN72DRAFT_906418 [Pluteus cervinus]
MVGKAVMNGSENGGNGIEKGPGSKMSVDGEEDSEEEEEEEEEEEAVPSELQDGGTKVRDDNMDVDEEKIEKYKIDEGKADENKIEEDKVDKDKIDEDKIEEMVKFSTQDQISTEGLDVDDQANDEPLIHTEAFGQGGNTRDDGVEWKDETSAILKGTESSENGSDVGLVAEKKAQLEVNVTGDALNRLTAQSETVCGVTRDNLPSLDIEGYRPQTPIFMPGMASSSPLTPLTNLDEDVDEDDLPLVSRGQVGHIPFPPNPRSTQGTTSTLDNELSGITTVSLQEERLLGAMPITRRSPRNTNGKRDHPPTPDKSATDKTSSKKPRVSHVRVTGASSFGWNDINR